MNLAVISGNLGQDPEVRMVRDGLTIMKLRVATSGRKKEGDQWVDSTEWHNVKVFGKRAEGLQAILCKGSRVLVNGEIKHDSYEKDGVTRYYDEILANSVEFVGGKALERNDAPRATSGHTPRRDVKFGGNDDEIPF